MKTTSNTTFRRIISCVGLLLALLPASAIAATYYVATTGNDTTGNGSIGNPWKTIQKAATSMTAGDTCLIRGGTYRETITPTNSGSSGNPITYKAYTGETVTIRGTELITGSWTQYSGSIYRTSVTLDMGEYNQVFVDNSMQLYAQWPNDSDGDPFTLEVKSADSGSDATHLVDSELTQANDYWNDAKLYTAGGLQWFWQSYTVTDFDAATDKLTLQGDTHQAANTPLFDPVAGSPYYLAGKLVLLDAAKEWYYDSSANYLYVWITGGGSPSGNTVEIKKRNLAFDLRSKSYINIEDLSIFAAEINGQGANHCSIKNVVAKYLNDSSVVNVDRVNAFDTDTKGLGFTFVGDYNEVRNCDIEYSGFSSIYMRGSYNKIVNNYIKDSNSRGGLGGAVVALGQNTLIAYNTIEDSGRLTLRTTNLQSSEVMYNVVSGAMTAHIKDAGILSASQCDYEHTVIHHNVFHDNFGVLYAPGMHVDNGTSNLIIHHNVVWNADENAMLMNQPNENTHVYNNTFIGNFEWSTAYLFGFHGTRFANNIFYGTFQDHSEISKSTNLIAYVNSVFTDPEFTDSNSNDYTLESGSPAIDAGTVISGITTGYLDSAPDIGAFEYGATNWQSSAGHNFGSPPNPSLASPPSIPFRNLIQNSGFEELTGLLTGDSLTGWTKTNNATASAQPNFVGTDPAVCRESGYKYYVRLGGGVDGIERTITGLTPYTHYTLSGFLKVDTGETVTLGAKDFGGTDTYVSLSTNTTYANRHEVTFKTGSSDTSAKVYVKKTSAGSGKAYIDDIYLVEKEVTKIDLVAMYADGSATVSTDMTWTDGGSPNVGIAGAFDGSVAYDYCAAKGSASVPSYYIISLDKNYQIKGLGICLKPGFDESADIYLSTDGSTWGSPVKTYTNADQSAIDSTIFTTPITARYIKVNVTAVESSTWPQLTEIEVYTAIDLEAKYLNGQITVDTDMTWTDSGSPNVGIAAAFDGSTAYDHGAGKGSSSTPSHYIITLDQEYEIKGLGICLKNGYSESADIYFSTDGVTWGTAVKTYTNATHTALDYTRFSSAIPAKFVKVNVTAASGWPMLTEIVIHQ